METEGKSLSSADINNRGEDSAMAAALSTKKIDFTCGIKQVWDVVTSLTDYGWRDGSAKSPF